jgi:hypothetical protein
MKKTIIEKKNQEREVHTWGRLSAVEVDQDQWSVERWIKVGRSYVGMLIRWKSYD